MEKIVYIHGLGGGKGSNIPKVLRKEIGNEYEIYNPELPIEPSFGVAYASRALLQIQPDLVVAHSLGGFYAMLLQGPWKTILVNPAMRPGVDIKNAAPLGLGKYPFEKGIREDGAKYIVIDEPFINELNELYNIYRKELKKDNLNNVYGLFTDGDELFSHIKDFEWDYKKKNMKVISNEKHSLSDEAIKDELIPLIKKLLK